SVASVVRPAAKPKVYFEEWDDPLISGIGWVSELIEIAGGEDVLPGLRFQPSAKDRIVSADQVRASAPDVILASWCGKKVVPDKIVEAMHRSPAGAEAQARNVVVQAIEAGVGERREYKILDGAAIDRAKGFAERGFRFGGVLQLVAFRQKAGPFHIGRIVGEE